MRPCGTARYASINCHRGYTHGRRDDLEALAHVLLYCLKGFLPWQLKGRKRKPRPPGTAKLDKWVRILEDKESVPLTQLCADCPVEFITYLKYVRNIEFAAEPDYDYLRDLFRQAFNRIGYKRDYIYDWTYLHLQKPGKGSSSSSGSKSRQKSARKTKRHSKSDRSKSDKAKSSAKSDKMGESPMNISSADEDVKPKSDIIIKPCSNEQPHMLRDIPSCELNSSKIPSSKTSTSKTINQHKKDQRKSGKPDLNQSITTKQSNPLIITNRIFSAQDSQTQRKPPSGIPSVNVRVPQSLSIQSGVAIAANVM